MVSFLPVVLLELVAPKQCFIPRNKEKLETKKKIKWPKSRDPAVSVRERNGTLLLPCSFCVLVVNSLVSRTISIGVQCLAQEG